MPTAAHTSAEGHLGYEKCLQGSVNGFWALFMGYFEYELSPKYWLGAFWEKQFFSFLRGKKPSQSQNLKTGQKPNSFWDTL